MKLILTAEVSGLGGPGDVVEVKDGYGRNYLLPQGFAILATRGAMKQVDSIRRAQETRRVRELDTAKEAKAALDELGTITVTGKASAGSKKLFGSVTAADVASAIKSQGGPTLDRRTIQLPEQHIKTVGKHSVTVRLHPEITVALRIQVTAG